MADEHGITCKRCGKLYAYQGDYKFFICDKCLNNQNPTLNDDREVEIRLKLVRTPEESARDVKISLENIKIIADVFSKEGGTYATEALKSISNIAEKALQ